MKFGEHKVRFVTYDFPPTQNVTPGQQNREFPVNMAGSFDCKTVDKTRTWLLTTCQVVENSSTLVSSLFGSYQQFCSENSELVGIPHNLFASFVWSVFPQVKLVGGNCFCGLQHQEEKNQVLRVNSPELMDSLVNEKIKRDKYSIKRVTNPSADEVNGLCEEESLPSDHPPKRIRIDTSQSPPPSESNLKSKDFELKNTFAEVENTIKLVECSDSESDSVDIATQLDDYFSKEYKDLPLECSWDKCKRRFDNSSARASHLIECHVNKLPESGGCCPWNDCKLTSHKKWSLISHILERHCPEFSPSVPEGEVQFTESLGGLEMSRLHCAEQVCPSKEFTCESEDALVKHIRMISAQIVLNWCRTSPEAVRMVRRYEAILSDMMLSGCDCKKILADCLYLIQLTDCLE